MNHKPIHIVFTTIFVPHLLSDLRANLERFGHLERVKVWVVGDLKTPVQAARLCADINANGLEVCFLDVAAQNAWGARVPEFYARLPFNNETRRNIGYLCALEAGCEILICLDDDNFPGDDDFIGGHMNTGTIWNGPKISETSGFHNVCEHLTIVPPRPIYPRGFPFHLRGTPNAPLVRAPQATAKIGVTAGLWLQEPDVDATTWLNGKITATAFTGAHATVLEHDTWTPLNTQNTSVARALIPAFLCVPMGYAVPGGVIQRYGDIWGGYFLQAVLKNTPYYVSFGRPLVEHRRNPHNYVDDLRFEFWGLILTDWLLQRLKNSFAPQASEIIERVGELAEFLHDSVAELPAWAPEPVQDFVRETAFNLAAWSAACGCFL